MRALLCGFLLLVTGCLLSPPDIAGAQAEGYNIRIGVTYCVLDGAGDVVFCDSAPDATVLVQTTAGDPIGSCVTEYVNYGNFGYSCRVFVPFSTEVVVTQDPASLRDYYGPDVVSVTLTTADTEIGVDRPLDATLDNTRSLNSEVDIWPVWIGSYTCPYGAGENDPGCEVVGDIGATVTYSDGSPIGYCVTEVGQYEGGPFSLCTVVAPMGADVLITLDQATTPDGYSASVTEYAFTTPIQRQDGIRGWDVAFRFDANAPAEETPVDPDPIPTEIPDTTDPVVQLPNTGSGSGPSSSVLLLTMIAIGTMLGGLSVRRRRSH